MTKFVGVAKGSRHSRPASMGADRRVALAMFQLTGETPAEEADALPAAVDEAARTQAHFQFAADGVPFGQPVVVELFDDRAPASAQEFRVRSLGAQSRLGAVVAYEGAPVVRLAAGSYVHIGEATAGHKAALEDDSLRHDAPGLVSFALGPLPRFSITLCACPSLDGRQQVVGRVVSGLSTVEELSRLQAEDGRPKQSLLVCACGTLASGSAAGAVSGLALSAEAKAKAAAKTAAERSESAQQTRSRLEQESERARSALSLTVREALNSNKRQKTGEGGPRGAGGMLSALLGGSSSGESGSDGPD